MIIDSLNKTHQQITHQFGWPEQMKSKKEKEGEDWIKMNMDYFASVAFSRYKDNQSLRKDYKLFNGEFEFNDYINNPDYQDIMNILTDSPITEIDVPQHLQHYSIINPPLNTLIGEFIKRPYKIRVEASDEESLKEKLDFRTEILKSYVIEQIKTKTKGMDPEQAQQVSEEELSGRIVNYTTLAEHWGNKMLESMRTQFNFKHTSTMSFRDFLITGKQFHHFFPDNSKLGFSYKVENPSNVWYLQQRNAMTTKDCWAIGTIEVLTMGEILSRYNLTGKEIDHLNTISLQTLRNNEYSPLSPTLPSPMDPAWQLTFESYGDFVSNDVSPNSYVFNSQYSYTVVAAYWQSKRKIFKRTYLDDQGYQQSDFVDEDYKICKECGDIKLEKLWINQWYKGVKIGADIYIDVEPLDFSQGPPIVGLINTTRNTQGKSPLQLLKPFQITYNILINQIRELLEKEIGVVFLGDLKAVPKDGSDDPIEQMLWNAKERGVLMIDTSQENTGTQTSFNQFTTVDLSRNNELTNRINIARAIKEEAWELVGITRQRLGSVLATETATGTNTALAQSYAQTEPWFMWHDMIIQEVYQTLLDIVQFIELKKPSSTLSYLNDDLEAVFLQISKSDLLRDLFVRVRSFSEDRDMLDTLRELAQPAMQNGAELSEIADLFTANSQRSLRDVLNKIQKRKEQQYQDALGQQQAELEQKQQMFEQQMQIEEQHRREDMDNENLNKELDRQNKIQIEQLRAISNEGSYDQDGDTISEVNEMARIALDNSKLNFERVIRNRELDIKEKEIKSKEKIAKSKPKPTKKK